MNNREIVLCEIGDKKLRKYSYTDGAGYKEITSITLPRGLDYDCNKELCESSLYLQQYIDTTTYELNPHNLKHKSKIEHKGFLRGIFQVDDPLYREEVGEGKWIIRSKKVSFSNHHQEGGSINFYLCVVPQSTSW